MHSGRGARSSSGQRSDDRRRIVVVLVTLSSRGARVVIIGTRGLTMPMQHDKAHQQETATKNPSAMELLVRVLAARQAVYHAISITPSSSS